MSNNKTFGEVLRNRRIELGAEINDISKSLHIKPTYLKAIENSNIDAMPSKAQARGFVSIYSEYLGLNKNEILSLFENQYTLQSDLTNGDIVDNYADHDNSAVFFNSSQENINIEKNNIVKLSEIIFQELGNDINKQRKKMGLSYEDVERYTFVKCFYLIAIEEGQINKLPSSVQAKGMIQNYLTFLGMDKDKYMLKFAEGLQLQLKEITTNNKNSISDHKSNTKKMTFWKKMLTPDMVVGTSIIFFLIIFGIWSASKIITLRNNELEAFNPSISDVLLNQPVELTITSTEIIPEQSTINNESTSVNIQPQQSDQTNLDPTLTFSPIDNSPIQLYIIPRQRAFVQIISDNVEIFNGRIVPGTVYPFSGNNKIQLITGNAAALKVLFNEQEIDNFGEVGEVINVIFTIDAITTPTSQNSPTPSATFDPTATIQLPTSTITPTVTPYIPE